MNSPDDKGVLVGKWSGEYSDGTAPSPGLEVLLSYKSTGKHSNQLNTDNAGFFQLCVQLVISVKNYFIRIRRQDNPSVF